MNLNKPAVIKKLQERFRNVNAGRGLYTAFLVPTMLTMFSTRAFAADTIWTKASAIMQDVYTQILGISTIAAVVTAAIALLLMNFSRSGRTVDESRASTLMMSWYPESTTCVNWRRRMAIFAMSSIRPSMSNVVNAHRSSGRIVL